MIPSVDAATRLIGLVALGALAGALTGDTVSALVVTTGALIIATGTSGPVLRERLWPLVATVGALTLVLAVRAWGLPLVG